MTSYVILDSSPMKASDEKDEYLGERKMPILNRFENIVGKEAFAQYDHFPQCFQRSCTTEAWKGVSIREIRVKSATAKFIIALCSRNDPIERPIV